MCECELYVFQLCCCIDDISMPCIYNMTCVDYKSDNRKQYIIVDNTK